MIVNVSEIKDGGLSLNLTRGPGMAWRFREIGDRRAWVPI